MLAEVITEDCALCRVQIQYIVWIIWQVQTWTELCISFVFIMQNVDRLKKVQSFCSICATFWEFRRYSLIQNMWHNTVEESDFICKYDIIDLKYVCYLRWACALWMSFECQTQKRPTKNMFYFLSILWWWTDHFTLVWESGVMNE